MSQANVEIVKKLLAPPGTDYTKLFGDDAAWEAYRSAIAPKFAPDFEGAFVAQGQRMEFAGLDGMRRTFVEWLGPWASYHDVIEDLIPVGEDRVVVLGRQRARLSDTAAEVVAESAGVYLLRDGRIVGVELYADRTEALQAVGL